MLDLSSIEDMLPRMNIMHPTLLNEIAAFLNESGMSESYFGKQATGNSEVVPRLRAGGRVWPETEAKLRSFILMRRNMARSKKEVSSVEDIQGQAPEKVDGGAA